jgi:hypothetical protein
MTQIDHFVPGNPAERQDDDILARLRWPLPGSVIRVYVEAYTQPGDAVLLPYGQSAAELREVLRLGRRPLAMHYDPLMVLLIQAALFPLPTRDLDAAVTRLGDSSKQGVPLRQALDELYATTCPACLRPAVADYFVWEQGLPVAKHLHCSGCEWEGEAGVEHADLQPLAEIAPRGMHYHYVLDRVSPEPEGNGLRARLEPLLELYTPRSLAALADLTRKIDALPMPGGEPARRALRVLLLDCLDRCSALVPAAAGFGSGSTRRRALARPARFYERNVWRSFEESAARARAWAALPDVQAPGADSESPALSPAAPWFVGQGVVRDLPHLLEAPGSLPLVLVSPPPLDLAAWSLSYFWGAWLLGVRAVAPLRPLLRLRTPDTAWYARVLAGSFRTLAEQLAPGGHMVLAVNGQRPPVLEALVWAATRAGLVVTTLLQSGSDYRLELAPASAPAEGRRARGSIEKVAREAIAGTIRARGEPAPWRSLHAAVQQRLSVAGLLASEARHDGEDAPGLGRVAEQVMGAWHHPSLVRFEAEDGEELWGLAQAGEPGRSLADRVESTAHAVLEEGGSLEETEFSARVYARLPGPLTPDPELIAACLRAYGTQADDGCWQLRPEDRTPVREQERREVIGLLLALGERLGYQAGESPPFDVAWYQGRQTQALFSVRWQATVGEVLAFSNKARGARLYLVIPGGRAALASFKLAHNPVWQQGLDEAGWRFIKYRHVRQLAAEPDVDEYALRAIVGLDPIVEREAVQMPLF